ARPTRPVGIWLELAAPRDAILAVHTVAGDFDVSLQQIAGGRSVTLLGGRALVERPYHACLMDGEPSQCEHGPSCRMFSCAWRSSRLQSFIAPSFSRASR